MRAWKTIGTSSGAGLALLLGACAPQEDISSASVAQARATHPSPAAPYPAGAPLPTGASIVAMSDQYSHPRRGAVSAAGASAWVLPAPPPAFVVTSPLPPADPPAPPPAAVANRQPAAPAPAPAAMPPAPQPAAATAPVAATADLAEGRRLFSQYACGGCHVLADAGGAGGIGPSLDQNPQLTRDYTIGAISEGRGTMPAFRDQMSADEIATLATYIVQAARK